MKRLYLWIGVLISVVALLAVGCAGGGGGGGGGPQYTIGIFQIITHPALDSAREGFKDAFKDALAAKGLNESEVMFMESNAAGSMDTCYTIADYFVSKNVSLICAISTPCVIAAATAVTGTTIPVVFNSVTNPLVVVASWEVPGGQITGVSDMAPVEPQLVLINDILTYNNLTLSKLGVIYNAGEPNSVYQVDTQLVDALAALNWTGNVTVVKATVSSGTDVPAATNALVSQNVSAIWVPTDNTVVGAFEAVVGPCQENDVPLFAADTATVTRGAIGCWGMDYYTVGNYSGWMAADILLNGANPATMPIETVPANLLYLNCGAATNTTITIPPALIAMADTTYGCG